MKKMRLQGYEVFCESVPEYHVLKREIWGYHSYYLDPEKYEGLAKSGLKILDVGGYIGLTTLYYARVYNNPEITVLEPNPKAFMLLEKNIWHNQVENVKMDQIALSDTTGKKALFFDSSNDRWYSTASFTNGAWNREQESDRVWVRTEQLSKYLKKAEWDIVKLDIEGAEERVLLEAKELIERGKRYLVEFHPVDGRGMGKIVGMFKERGYKVEVVKNGKVLPWHKVRGLALIRAIK